MNQSRKKVSALIVIRSSWLRAGCVLATTIGLLLGVKSVAAPETNDAVSPTLITNLDQFWSLSASEKSKLHHARLELLIYYCDPDWNVYWGRSDNLDTFLPLKGIPRALKGGDKVLVDGLTLPVNQEFLWDKTSITVLSESNSFPLVSAAGRLLDASGLDKHMVEVEALVDSQTSISTNMLQLSLLSQDFNFAAYVTLKNKETMPELAGKLIRITGVYSETYNFGNVADITLWSPGLNCVTTMGSLETDPRFSTNSIPLTTADNFDTLNPNVMIRVQGVVRSQLPGRDVTIWDATGQIRLLTKQQQVLNVNDRIEAIGYPTLQGIDHVLQNGLFRVASNQMVFPTNETQLRLVAQIDDLDQASLNRQLPIRLEGVVTWVNPNGKFSYIFDGSGGIRVLQATLQSGRPMAIGMIVQVDGSTGEGRFAPIITNAMIQQTSDSDLPDAPLVSLAEASTGAEDGNWIQMRGYVRRITVERNSIRLGLVSPDGNFVARVPLNGDLENLYGSVILVKGVCVANANSRRQLTGIEIWSPEVREIQVEQRPPADLFALPMRTLPSLRQFNPFNTLNERVRTSGTVTLQVPGQYLYIQDGDSAVLALCSQTNLLSPGDRVELVGFCGNEGGSFLLREAAWRRISSGADPLAVELPAMQSITDDLDGLLVHAKGVLLDEVKKTDETDLIIQAQGQIFQVILNGALPSDQPRLELGSQLDLKGVYRTQRDEYGNPRSFKLNLRNVQDVQVLQPPPWWTSTRLLWVLAGALLIILVSLLWGVQVRRRNTLLMQSQAELKAARDKLEERVQERTRELSEQVEEKERANERLSEAQQRLIIASRQAGMAEMATSVLHNVGNVLNSVNISASLIGDSVQKMRIENLEKAVEMLNHDNGDPVDFLTKDPRGRALPGYLHDLAGVMGENRRRLQDEVKSLVKQVDHVKAIVALQQDYARNSNIVEILDPVEMMEDAFEINRDAYERHRVTVVREYEDPPGVFADRHKVLQILINFLSNAKYAVKQSAEKRVTFRILAAGDDRVRFEISDTGIGIEPENLQRVFMLGFTTRSNGHGFGLHSGANAAKEMNGEVLVFSQGPGRGATFVLELPAARNVASVSQSC